MSRAMVLPGRRRPVLAGVVDVRRVSKPMLSWLILVATAFVVALVLLVWLLLWLSRPKAGMDGWWVAQRGLALPVIGHQADDLGKLVRSAPRDTGYPSLEQVLRNRLAGAGTRPVIVYVSAAGVADNLGAFLLPPEPGSLASSGSSGSRQGLMGAEALVDLFGAYPSRKKLLILDAGQVGSDRNLGVYANGFVFRLKSYLATKPAKGLAVLCSCAPGQWSWSSETDRRSAFGYYVALGLSGRASGWDASGRGLTVRALGNYVRHHVSRWSAANRQAEQTPELLGDPSVNFALPRMTPTRGLAPAAEEKDAERLLARLDEAWSRSDALQAVHPFRHTPLAWQQYRETLLRAERLFRVGQYTEADDALANLPALEKKIRDAAGGLPMDPYWSLALFERALAEQAQPSEKLSAEWTAANDKLDEALKELARGAEEAEAAPEAAPEPAPAATGPAPAVAKEGGSTKKAEPPKPPARPKEKPKGEAALPGLIARGEDRPLYVEAQLLVWAGTFARRNVAAYSFKGPRAEMLDEALQTRRLAEKAAAADERIARWVVPLVEDGDALRRRVQDGLFAGDTGQFEALGRVLEQSRTRYREASAIADRAAKALDLVEQVEADLPYYGEWKARRGGRLDQDFLDLMKATAVLARQIRAEPAAPRGDDDRLTSLPDQVKAWESQYREVRTGLDRLQGEFQADCAGLSASGGSGRFREIDAALATPLVPAEVRRPLLRLVRSATVAGTLAGADGLAPPPTTTEVPSDFTSYAKAQTQKSIASDRTAGREEIAEIAGGPAAPDPDFWRNALALARLEWGLCEIGGISEDELARLETAYESARIAVKGEPPTAFDAFAKLSDLIRSLRADRVRAIREVRAASYPALADADAALRVVPLADALALSDKPVEALDRHARYALLLWHGNRLLRDFAPGHARRVLENAQLYQETDALRAALDQSTAMAQAKLDLKADPDTTLTIEEWSDRPMGVALSASGDVPEGEATVLVGFDPRQPVSVTEKATQRPAREGVLAPARADRNAAHLDYLVGRTESTYEPIALTLSPIAFYRGHFFTADRGVSVSLDPANDPVKVTIGQSYRGMKFIDFTDQFKEHPGQGYLHYGTNLQYKLVLETGPKPMKVVVRYGLKEHPESFKTQTVEIDPKKKAEVVDIVKGDDFQIVKTAEELSIAPLTLQVTVFKDRENGEIQGKGKYTFRMIPPPQYISTHAEYDSSIRVLWVWVTHLANDPVTGPVEIFASVGGGEMRGWIRRSKIAPFWFFVPPTVKSVTWRVGVEGMPSAFRETVETPPPPAAAPEPPPQ